MTDQLRPRKTPCATCPYRKDVPSGIWSPEEYDKLPRYDGSTTDQVNNGAFAVFMCHQQDGCMCAGWIGTHDPDTLLALRFEAGRVDWDAVHAFESRVPLHESGAVAMVHGMHDVAQPSTRAVSAIEKLIRSRGDRDDAS